MERRGGCALRDGSVAFEAVLDALARVLGERPRAPTPDALKLDALGVVWTAVPTWQSAEDLDLAAKAGLWAVPFTGVLFVVTEYLLASRRGPLEVDAARLPELVGGHLARFGECFFNGDVVIVDRAGETLWVFHHDGCAATVARPRA